MTEEEPVDPRLYEILSAISTPPKKREYFEFIVDRHRRADGFLSEFYLGKCKNKDNGEITHIVIKVVPVCGFISSYGDIYRNEVYFYSTIFRELDKFQKEKGVSQPFVNVARFLTGHLIEKKEFLIMENLKPAGYKLLNEKECPNSEHLKMIFQTYGKFHALSFVYKHEYPEAFSKMTSELVDIMKSMTNRDMTGALEAAYFAVIDTFNSELESDIVKRLKKVENVQQTLANARNYKGDYVCITHGDCRLSNMLFKHKESGELEDVKLIDFQLVYASTPIHDLSYFFYSAAAKVDMDKLDYYLELYYNSFSSFVVELGADPEQIYPFKVLKEEWTKYSVTGIILGIGLWPRKLMNKNVFSLTNQKSISKEKCFELWKAEMSEIRRGNVFRNRARDICLHAIEYGIL